MADDGEDELTPHERRIQALAEERTYLARERTVLAHLRTGFAAFLFGVALLELFESPLALYTGWFFLGAGILFLLTSGLSYLLSQRRVRRFLRPTRWRLWRSHEEGSERQNKAGP